MLVHEYLQKGSEQINAINGDCYDLDLECTPGSSYVQRWPWKVVKTRGTAPIRLLIC